MTMRVPDSLDVRRRGLFRGQGQIVVRIRRLTIKSRRPCTMRNPAQALLDTRC